MSSGVFDSAVFDCAVFDCGTLAGKAKQPDEDFISIWRLLEEDEDILAFTINAVTSGILEE